jgi:predicted nuclease with TOPRIM domain
MFFKKYKMKIKDLQKENEQLKAQMSGLAFNLRAADERIKNYEMQLENLYKKNTELLNEVRHLNMLAMTSNNNKNDSRYY